MRCSFATGPQASQASRRFLREIAANVDISLNRTVSELRRAAIAFVPETERVRSKACLYVEAYSKHNLLMAIHVPS